MALRAFRRKSFKEVLEECNAEQKETKFASPGSPGLSPRIFPGGGSPGVSPRISPRLPLTLDLDEPLLPDIDGVPKVELQRCLTIVDLVAFGFNSMVGAGIFVVVGSASMDAGPAVIFSICLSGFACATSGVCFAEFASALPSSGSGYAYLYVVMGELPAFLCGHLLSLSLCVAGGISCRAAVGYLSFAASGMQGQFGYMLGAFLADYTFVENVIVLNACAPVLSLSLTLLLLSGTKDSSTFSNFMAVVNVTLLISFIVTGAFYSNWENIGDLAPNGFTGVLKATGLMFYSFVGFDSVCTLSQEAKRPEFSIPVSLLGSLLIVTLLYCGVSAALLGMTPLATINLTAPLSQAFENHGLMTMFHLVTVAAITNTLATGFTGIMAQPRLWIHMANDGLAPAALQRLDHRQVPRAGTVLAGLIATICCTTFPIELLADLCSAGILFAYMMVCVSLLVVRWGVLPGEKAAAGAAPRPSFPLLLFLVLVLLCVAIPVAASCMQESEQFLPVMASGGALLAAVLLALCLRSGRGRSLAAAVSGDGRAPAGAFECPGFPLTPCAGIMVNSYVISGMGLNAAAAAALWVSAGICLYALYGYRHSRLGQDKQHE